MSQIFISYSRKDKAVMEEIAAGIREATGVDPWIDMSGVETGTQFKNVIIKAIDECKVLVFVISKNSLESDWTQKEVEYARNTNKKICPLNIDGTQVKSGWFVFDFGGTDCIDYRDAGQRRKMYANLSTWMGLDAAAGRSASGEAIGDRDGGGSREKTPFAQRFAGFAKWKCLAYAGVGLAILAAAGIVGHMMLRNREGSREAGVNAWELPEIRIESPVGYDGDSGSASSGVGDRVGLRAVVRGGIASTVWNFEQYGKTVATVVAKVQDGMAAGECILTNSGLYNVSVTGEGPAGKACATIQFFVRPAEETMVKLNVELEISHGPAKEATGAGRKVVYLVLDRSGSMGEKSLSDGRTPNEALLETLKMQLDAIQLGSEVHVIPFSSEIWDEVVYAKLDESGRKAIIDFVKYGKPKGQTVLYDAQDMALTAAAKVMEADENAEVRVLVYTDGSHYTPLNYKGEYRACGQKMGGGLGRKRVVDNPAYEEELAAAKKKFEAKFGDLIASPNLEVEYEWLSESPKPEAKMHTKACVPFRFKSYACGMRDPFDQVELVFRGELHFPISNRAWAKVQGRPFLIEWSAGGKVLKTLKLDLRDGKTTGLLVSPMVLKNTPTETLITFKDLPEGEKFLLKSPRPVICNMSPIEAKGGKRD